MNVLDAGYAGAIYPINTNRSVVQGLKAYPSIHDTPAPVDCAIIAQPSGMRILGPNCIGAYNNDQRLGRPTQIRIG